LADIDKTTEATTKLREHMRHIPHAASISIPLLSIAAAAMGTKGRTWARSSLSMSGLTAKKN
jgi:hypothetical protein